MNSDVSPHLIKTSSAADTDGMFDLLMADADTTVWIVTTVAQGRNAGCLMGFATQASIAPRRFLACLSKANHTYLIAREARHLAVHQVGPGDTDLAQLFGAETGSNIDKFDHCDWYRGPHSLPILAAAAGFFAGEIVQRTDFGDHVGMLLRPTAVHRPNPHTPPLRYRAVDDLPPGHDA